MTALLSIGFIVLALIEVVSVWARVRLLYWRKRLTLAQEYSNSLDEKLAALRQREIDAIWQLLTDAIEEQR